MIEKILEIVFVVSIISIFGYLIIDNVLTKIKNKNLFIAATQAELDRLAVYDQTQEILKREAERVESSDGFLRFVSDSREWAFSYIEEVQEAVNSFKSSIQEIVLSYEIDKSNKISEEDLQKIIDAYNELIKILPKE
jgi:ADP-dependent phosphofructokinase/glucokinase